MTTSLWLASDSGEVGKKFAIAGKALSRKGEYMNASVLRNVSQKVSWEDGQESAARLWNQACETGEDFAYQITRHVRKHPWKSLAVALGAGVVLGALISLSTK